MRFLKQFAFVCFLHVAVLSAQVQGTKIKDYLSDNKKITSLDSLVDAVSVKFIQNPENCGISIGISKNGTSNFYNYGEIKRKSGVIPDQQTIYEIGSLTKTFCGILLAQAVIEKKINLEDDIRKYLPGNYHHLVFGKTFIRVKHLANHSSGLPRVPNDMMSKPDFDSLNPYKNYTKEMLFKYLKTAQLETEPGTICSYSNMGMALLGIILEEIYNKSFEILVREKICIPNTMTSTGIALNPEQLKKFADGHNSNGSITPHWDFDGLAAAGALRSTSEDLLRYLNYNLAEKDEATKLAHEITYSAREKVGLAWFVKKTNSGNTLTWHNGVTYGFSSFAGFIKEKDCSVIILSNSLTSVDYIALAIFKYLEQ